MESRYTGRSPEIFKQLDKEIKSKDNIWSVRVGIGWRALGVVKANEDKIVWFWIGSYAEYDKILRKK